MEKENKYLRSKIYKIISNKINDVYIGSTTKGYLCSRLAEHKADYKRWLENKHRYMTSFELVKLDDCKIELIENYQCKSKKELSERERFYIESIDCVNKNIPGRTVKEYSDEYRKVNKEKIKIKKAIKIICECGIEYNKDHKARHERSKYHKSKISIVS